MTDGRVLEFTGVTKTFDGIAAVSDFTARVEPGHVTAFLGPNGAGKTTTLRILLGQLRATSGTATIGGKSYALLSSPRRTVGWVAETPHFRPRRTARRHLGIVAKHAGLPAARVDEVLDLVGLAEIADMRISGYSLGMTQRLAVAESLLGDPGVLVFDEPANGLDPEGIRWMRLLMRGLADEGRTVLVSSHVLSEIQQVADRLIVISNGSLVFAGGIEDLEDASSQAVAVDSPDRTGLSRVLREKGYEFDLRRSGINVQGADAAEIGAAAAAAGIALSTLQPRNPSLEDVFLRLINGDYIAPMTAALPGSFSASPSDDAAEAGADGEAGPDAEAGPGAEDSARETDDAAEATDTAAGTASDAASAAPAPMTRSAARAAAAAGLAGGVAGAGVGAVAEPGPAHDEIGGSDDAVPHDAETIAPIPGEGDELSDADGDQEAAPEEADEASAAEEEHEQTAPAETAAETGSRAEQTDDAVVDAAFLAATAGDAADDDLHDAEDVAESTADDRTPDLAEGEDEPASAVDESDDAAVDAAFLAAAETSDAHDGRDGETPSPGIGETAESLEGASSAVEHADETSADDAYFEAAEATEAYDAREDEHDDTSSASAGETDGGTDEISSPAADEAYAEAIEATDAAPSLDDPASAIDETDDAAVDGAFLEAAEATEADRAREEARDEHAGATGGEPDEPVDAADDSASADDHVDDASNEAAEAYDAREDDDGENSAVSVEETGESDRDETSSGTEDIGIVDDSASAGEIADDDAVLTAPEAAETYDAGDQGTSSSNADEGGDAAEAVAAETPEHTGYSRAGSAAWSPDDTAPSAAFLAALAGTRAVGDASPAASADDSIDEDGADENVVSLTESDVSGDADAEEDPVAGAAPVDEAAGAGSATHDDDLRPSDGSDENVPDAHESDEPATHHAEAEVEAEVDPEARHRAIEDELHHAIEDADATVSQGASRPTAWITPSVYGEHRGDSADTPDSLEQADETVDFDDTGEVGEPTGQLPGAEWLTRLLAGEETPFSGAAVFIGRDDDPLENEGDASEAATTPAGDEVTAQAPADEPDDAEQDDAPAEAAAQQHDAEQGTADDATVAIPVTEPDEEDRAAPSDEQSGSSEDRPAQTEAFTFDDLLHDLNEDDEQRG